MTKKKNPVIEKAREEGIKLGMKTAQEQTFLFFFEFLEENLNEIPGIGPKRKQHVIDYFLKNFGHEKTQEK
ncbi:hypothetical protein ABEI56_05425 [Peribacillus castrilensis]|uniref:hypothetical protein n=1 Tax=Peribacillus castrilensis TaxID=2897690 RepID=UPI003D2991D1